MFLLIHTHITDQVQVQTLPRGQRSEYVFYYKISISAPRIKPRPSDIRVLSSKRWAMSTHNSKNSKGKTNSLDLHDSLGCHRMYNVVLVRSIYLQL